MISRTKKETERRLKLSKSETEEDSNRKGYSRNDSCLRFLLYTTRPNLYFYVKVISRDMQRYIESCEATMKICAISTIPIVGDSRYHCE